MAYVALQLNGVTMPWPALPDGYKEDRSFPEVFRELSNGVVAQQLLRSGSVIIFSIAWKGLTLAEYALWLRHTMQRREPSLVFARH